MVAGLLPEAQPIFGQELQPAQPLAALPQVGGLVLAAGQVADDGVNMGMSAAQADTEAGRELPQRVVLPQVRSRPLEWCIDGHSAISV